MPDCKPPEPLPYKGHGCYERPVRAKQKPVQRFKRPPRINVEPDGLGAVPCRAGTMQQKFVEALHKGATWDELRAVAIRADGTPWDDKAISALMYSDLRGKGYGIRTKHDLDRGLYYQLIMPDAV